MIANLSQFHENLITLLPSYPMVQEILQLLPIPNSLKNQVLNFQIQNLLQPSPYLEYYLIVLGKLFSSSTKFIEDSILNDYPNKIVSLFFTVDQPNQILQIIKIFHTLITNNILTNDNIEIIIIKYLEILDNLEILNQQQNIEILYRINLKKVQQTDLLDILEEKDKKKSDDNDLFVLNLQQLQDQQNTAEQVIQIEILQNLLTSFKLICQIYPQILNQVQLKFYCFGILSPFPKIRKIYQTFIQNQMNPQIFEYLSQIFQYQFSNELIDILAFQSAIPKEIINKSIEYYRQGRKEVIQLFIGEIGPFIKEIIQDLWLFQGDQRDSTFKILSQSNQSFQQLQYAVEEIDSFIKNSHWRTNLDQDWGLELIGRKQNYVGLKNLGCTCYMNVIIQNFFKITKFSKQILTMNIKEGILEQFQLLFAQLYSSQRMFLDTKPLFSVLQMKFEHFNPNEQMDVDEFLSYLLDQMKNEFKQNNQEDIINSCFNGTLSNEVIGKSCPHSSEKEESFLTLNLPIKNKKSIQDCLASFVQEELMEKSNAYFCDHCNKKVSAIRRVCLKQLPQNLIIVLKRFDINFDKMSKYKINDQCDFPNNLDMKPYTNNQNENPGYFQYRLKGVVIHRGSAESGHYYSYIKEDNHSLDWYEYNDINVVKFDSTRMSYEAFGGTEQIKNMNEEVIQQEKNHNAYVLIYQRVLQKTQNNEDLTQSPVVTQYVKKDMERFKLQWNLVDNNFGNYLLNQKQYPIFRKVIINYYKVKKQREVKYEFRVIIFAQTIQKLLIEDEYLCEWFITQFSQSSIQQEFLIDCPISDMVQIVTGMIEIALQFVKFKENSYYTNFIDNMFQNITEMQANKCSFLFKILVQLSKNKECKLYMLKNNVLEIILSHLQNIPINQQTSANFLMFKSDLGHYERVAEVKKTENNYNYCIILLSKLITSLCFNQYFDDNIHINYMLKEQDKKMIISGKFYQILPKSKAAQKSLGKLIYHISYQNESSQLINFLFNFLTNQNETQYGSSFCVIKYLLFIQDSYQDQRVQLIIKNFFDFLIYNKKVYISFETTLDMIFLLAKQCMAFQLRAFEILQQEALASTISDNIQQTANIHNLLQNKIWVLFRNIKYQLIPQAFQNNAEKWKNQINKRMKSFRSLQKNQFEFQEETGLEKKIKLIQNYYYDLLIDDNYISVQIEEQLPGMTLVKGENYKKWLRNDCELFFPHAQYSRQNQDKFQFYKFI